MAILGEEPILDMMPIDIRELWLESKTVEDRTAIYAAVHNKVPWMEDEVYDFTEGTTQYCWACEWADAWSDLEDMMESEMMALAEKEGLLEQNAVGTIRKLEPFMRKYGFRNANGWWLRIDDNKKVNDD